MTIPLNPDLEQRIASKVKSGRYPSPVEAIQESLDLLKARDAAMHVATPSGETPVWEAIVNLGHQVPEEEWAQIPNDLARNVDHYLYGSPKVSE